ncbi:MAG: PIG-L family deacetylase [Pseudomonadota bacterium]
MTPTKNRRAPSALIALTIPLALAMSAPVTAQSDPERTLAPQEEVLEDGTVVTRILPGQRPNAIRPKGEPERNENGDVAAGPLIDPKVPSVLAILSHPDDELIIAPVLARIAREQGEVTLVFATSGDAGPGISDLEKGTELAELRESEARCSAFALGLEEPIFWRFGDGTLANEARNSQGLMRDLSGRIAGLIALQEPTVIMTWGPDGGYGHSDHRITSNAVTQILQDMGPGRPDLLYAAFPALEGDDAELPGFDGWGRTHPSLVTDKIAYEVPDLDAAIASVNCYESQFSAEARRALAGTLHAQVWKGNVPFRLAFVRQR